MNVLFFKSNGQNYFVDANKVRYIVDYSNLNITTIPNNKDSSSLGWYMYQKRVYVVKDSGIMFQQYKIKEPKAVILFDNLVALIVESTENVVEINEQALNSSPIINKFISSVLIHNYTIHMQVDVDSLRNYKSPKYIKKE